MRYILDRVEEDTAVLFDGQGGEHHIARALLPMDAAEGDTILLVNGAYQKDPDDRESRRRRIAEKMRRLKERGE